MPYLRDILLKYKLTKEIEINPKIKELKKNESLEKKKDTYYNKYTINTKNARL